MRKFISAALAALAVISIGVAVYMYVVGSAAGKTITEYEKVTTYKLREPSTRYKFKTVDKSYFVLDRSDFGNKNGVIFRHTES